MPSQIDREIIEARLTMGGQILIYRHMGWQHRAYVASGLPALQWVADNDSDSVNGIAGQSALELNVWTDLDTAIQQNNHEGIKGCVA